MTVTKKDRAHHIPLAGTAGARPANWFGRLLLSAVLLACGMLVFAVFSHYSPFYKGDEDKIGRIVTAGGFLALALLARSSSRFQKYWLLPCAFFAALTAISLDY